MPKKRLLAMLAAAGVAVAGAVFAIAPMTASSAAEACAPAYNAGTQYWGGTKMSWNGRNYTAKWWTQGATPPGPDNVWQDNGPCGGGGGGGSCNAPDWVAGRHYPVGSIVRYKGAYYRAEHENPGYDPVESHWFWKPHNCSGGGGGNPTTPPPGNGGGNNGFPISEAQFNRMFPQPPRVSFYTYAGFVEATKKFPAFGATGDTAMRKREIAAFLANVHHESGGLFHITEVNRGTYCESWRPYGCPAGAHNYFGRGPIQLSWNYNYKLYGDAIGVDLLNQPWRVEQEAWIAWGAAIWYWMTQTGPGTMTGHNAIVNNQGFGQTIWSINGRLECNGGNPAQVGSRVNKFREYIGALGTDAGPGNISC